MGFSCSQKASRTLDSLMTLLQNGRTTGPSNTWEAKVGTGTVELFYEVDRVDQADGGIVGDVESMSGGRTCTGRFRIDGDGVVRSFPGTTADQRNKALENALAPGFRESRTPRI